MRARALAIITLVSALFLVVPSFAFADTAVDANTTQWSNGTYTVSNTVEIEERIEVTGNVKLVLGANAQLTAKKGITVNNSGNSDASNVLTIEGEDTGKLIATGVSANNDGNTVTPALAGIGGDASHAAGTIVIKSGIVEATGGAGLNSPMSGAAGIGGGGNSSEGLSNGGTIQISGGKITATGGANGGAGIGGGAGGGCVVRIQGGEVSASATDSAADIGGGSGSPNSQANVTVMISGGKVTAGNTGIGAGSVDESIQTGSVSIQLGWTKTDDYIMAKYRMPVSPDQGLTKSLVLAKSFYDDTNKTPVTGSDYLPTNDQSAIKIVPRSCTVTFDTAGGQPATIDSQIVSYGAKATKPDDPTLDKYTFKGWLKNGQEFDFDTAITEDTDLIAQWEEYPKVTITFNPNGGEGTMSPNPQTVYKDEAAKLNPNTYTRKRYVFVGWNTAADASGTAYANEATNEWSTNVDLYAQWMEGVTWYVETGKGAPSVLADNLETVANELVSDGEASIGAEIRLVITALASKNVSSVDKNAAQSVLSEKGAKAGAWFDASLYKQVTGSAAVAVHKTTTPVELSVVVPTGLRAKGRTFYLIRIHDGNATVLGETTEDVLRGKTDVFSTYLIAYKEGSSSGTSDTSNSNNSNSSSTSSKSSTANSEALANTSDPSFAGLLGCVFLGLAFVTMGVLRQHR